MGLHAAARLDAALILLSAISSTATNTVLASTDTIQLTGRATFTAGGSRREATAIEITVTQARRIGVGAGNLTGIALVSTKRRRVVL